ncbi:ceramide kinase-like [Liolophura sinensis]|uniref:ceramide kinase-like n=1 Tax=Liolophura sinensis TaxID=3198878 RepID=UPI0031594DC7
MADSTDSSIIKQSQFRLFETVKKVSFELECELMLRADSLSWKWQSPPPEGKDIVAHTEEEVRISWVLRVLAEPDDMGDETSHAENAPTKLVIYFVRRLSEPDFQYCVDNVTLHGPSSLCEEWVITLTDHLHRTAPQRPKSLLVIINPCSGGKKAEKMFKNDIAPIFQLAGIKTDVRVTAEARDSFNILGNIDLSVFDGLVSVGGDGTHYEVIAALIRKTMKDKGVEELTSSTVLQSPSIRHGMIPAGTGNGGQLFASYSKDPVTNAIVIALGDSKPRDILSLHCGDKFLDTCFFACAYGLMAQALDTMENYRWTGPLRFVAGCFVGIVKHAPVLMTIDYLPGRPSVKKAASEPKSSSAKKVNLDSMDESSEPIGVNSQPERTGENPVKARQNIEDELAEPGNVSQREGAGEITKASQDITDEATDPGDGCQMDGAGEKPTASQEDDLPPGWVRLHDKILEVDIFCFPNMDMVDLNRYYLSEHTMEKGAFTLLYSKPCGRIAHMKFIAKLIEGNLEQAVAECGFVECINVKECRVRAVLDKGDRRPMKSISCDGETITSLGACYEVRCHPGLLDVFARTDGGQLRELCNIEKATSLQEKTE